MESFVNAIEFIPVSGGIREINFGSAVTVDTPAHAEFGELFHLVHLGDGSVAGLALHFTCADMLGMVEIYMVGQVVDLNPFDLLYRALCICRTLDRSRYMNTTFGFPRCRPLPYHLRGTTVLLYNR